jgi:hypothetical protein
MRLGTKNFYVAAYGDAGLKSCRNGRIHGRAYGLSVRFGSVAVGVFALPHFDFKVGRHWFIGEVPTWSPGRQYQLRILWFALGVNINSSQDLYGEQAATN